MLDMFYFCSLICDFLLIFFYFLSFVLIHQVLESPLNLVHFHAQAVD